MVSDFLWCLMSVIFVAGLSIWKVKKKTVRHSI